MNKRVAITVATASLLALVPFARAQSGANPAQPSSADDKVIQLNPFTVTSEKDQGYRKLSSVTTSRIGVSIYETPQAVEIISGELLHDFNLTSIRDVFQYSSSVTFNKQEVFQAGTFKMRGFDLPQYVNGVLVAGNTSGPGYVSSDNVERVELAKGPVGLFYGNSSPNGVANTVTKKPEYLNKTNVELSAGSYGYQKALVDTQAVVSRDYGIAYRLISAVNNSKTRIGQSTDYTMLSATLSVRPNDKIWLQAEFDTTDFKQAYAAVSTWNFQINPLYYQEVASPGQPMINYVKTKYGAATDAAALDVIATRWGIKAPKASLNYLQVNWTADYFGAYGRIAYPFTGSTLNYDRYAPGGDRFTSASPDSKLDGINRLADVSLTLTPFEKTSLQYHWVHNTNNQNFWRGLVVANPGPLDAKGRVPSLGFNAMQIQQRDADSDTQQIDVSHEFTVGGVKNRFIGGVEFRRITNFNGSATLDQTKAPVSILPDGSTQSGLATVQNFLPFSQPWPQLQPLQVSAINQVRANPVKYQDEYISYRGAAFSDKLNLLAGVRRVTQKTRGVTSTGNSELTKSIGAIGQVSPGLYVFADYNTTFQFSSGYDVAFVSNNLPTPEGKPLGPETGRGYEVGLKSSLFGEKLSGTVSYFEIERDGVVGNDINGQNNDPRNSDLDPNNNVRYNLNGGLQRSRGVDGNLVWTPSSNFQVLANFTYLIEAQVISDPAVNITNINVSQVNAQTYDKLFRHNLAKSPTFAAGLVAKYTFRGGALDGLFVGAGARYSGKWYVSDNFNYDIYVEPETTFDAFAGYAFKVARIPTSVQVNLTNLTDQINDVTHSDGFLAQIRLTAKF